MLAIDGPGGSGKSTIAKKVAERLGILYIDTGAMYRALALAAHEANVPFTSPQEIQEFLTNLKMQYGVSPAELIVIDGKNLTQRIREHHVSKLASEFSQILIVRNHLVDFQRKLGLQTFCVMEGRDIGTVVFPDAFCKIFLTASLEIRARRRLEELKQKGQNNFTLEQVLSDVQERDRQDMQRKESPLKQAGDAILLDTSSYTIEQVQDKIIEVAKKKASEHGLRL